MKNKFCTILFHGGYIAWTVLRALGMIVCLLLAVAATHAQATIEVHEASPMPRPLTVNTTPSCNVVTHTVAQVLDAKTSLPKSIIVRYRVEPSARTGKKVWHLPEETLGHSDIKRPGALGDYDSLVEAVGKCEEWQSAVMAAEIKLLVAQRTAPK